MERLSAVMMLAVALLLLVAGGFVIFMYTTMAPPATPAPPSAGIALPPDAARLAGIEVRMDDIERRVQSLGEAATKLKSLEGQLDRLEESLADISKAAKEAARARPRPAPPAPQPRVPPVRGEARTVLADDFERGIVGWIVPKMFDKNVIGELSHATGEGVAKAGRGAMKLSFKYQEDKIALAVRTGLGVREVNRVEFWIKTERPTLIFVGATEFDQSTYGMSFELRAADGWYHCKADYSEFALSQGSRDENDRLDPGHVIGLCIGDAGGFVEQRGANTLLIDGFSGLSVPEGVAAEPEGAF